MKLKFPVRFESGNIVDSEGNTIIKANRETGTTPLSPAERDDLLKIVTSLLNKEEAQYPELFESSLNENLNEDIQILDKVRFEKDRGYVIGEIEGKLLVQIQGSTVLVDPSQLKEFNKKLDLTTEPHMKFDEKTQKLLFEQFVKCAIYFGNVPIKMNNCYVKYSQWEKANPDQQVKVLMEGNVTFMPKAQVKILEDLNDFANEENYVPGVLIDETTGEATEKILVNAIEYTQALGDADSVQIIRQGISGEQEMQSAPKSMIRTLAV